jgi:hypothetical protein
MNRMFRTGSHGSLQLVLEPVNLSVGDPRKSGNG